MAGTAKGGGLMNNIYKGCIVQLRSGSPDMVVEGIDGHQRIMCVYFDGKNVVQISLYPSALVVVK